MKIYNEIMIDMNPESSTYGEHLSEQSFEYNGNLDLCCGGSDHAADFSLQKPTGIGSAGKGAVGYQAWGFGAPGSTQTVSPFGGTKMVHPSHLPGSVFGEVAPLQGVQSLANRQIQGVDITPFNPNQPATTGGSNQFLGMTVGSRPTPKGRLAEEAERYGQQFKSGWYDPYIKAAVEDPAREAVGAQTMTVQDRFGGAIPQGLIEDYRAQGGPTAQWGYDDQVITAGTAPTGAGQNIRTGLEFAAGDYGTAMKGISDEETALNLASTRLGQNLATAEIDREEALSRAQISREKQRTKLAADRLSGIPKGHEIEKAYVPLAKSGFAASGPVQAQVRQVQEAAMDKLRQSVVGGRLGEESYQKAVSDIEKGHADMLIEHGRAAQDIQTDLTGLADKRSAAMGAFDTAKLQYGGDIAALANTASQELGNVTSWINQLRGAHEGFGQAMETKSTLPSLGGGYQYKIRGIGDMPQTVGTTAYGAPAGGYFTEQGTPYGIEEGKADIGAAQSFGDYLGGRTIEQILGAEFGTDWEGMTPEQMGLPVDTGETGGE